MGERRAVTKAMRTRYANGTKTEKSAVLDALCQATGWHRDHARKALRTAIAAGDDPPPPRTPRTPPVRYDQACIEVLVQCWAALDGPAAKRLHAALPKVIDNLTAHGHLDHVPAETIDKVLTMSPATIDRRLAPARAELTTGKGLSHTRPGSLLKASIPMKTWAHWDNTRPGFLQIDLVGHEGGDNNGEFHHRLDATDIATGWTETITDRSKAERIDTAALEQLVLRFPFHIAGIHSDNGSEFINHHLLKWCDALQITFSRGRPSRSNDQAHVEQKNWTVVRRNVGYYRYDTPRELDLLNQLWPLVSTQVNLFLPQQKLLTKTRHGAKVIKTHDTARTPFDRLRTDHANLLDPHDLADLEHRHAHCDLIELKHHIADIQANLLELARRRGHIQRRAKTNHVYLSRQKMPRTTRASSHESTTPTTRAS